MSDLRRVLREPILAAIIAAVAAALVLFVLLPLFKVFQMSVRIFATVTLPLALALIRFRVGRVAGAAPVLEPGT